MATGYSFRDYDKNTMARSFGRALPISFKQAIEVCNFIRNKKLHNAKKILSMAAEKKQPVPFKRFVGDLGHKKKIGPARYPVNTSIELLRILEDAEANAQFKGLNTSKLTINAICAKKAPTVWRYGRKRRRLMKRTHVEVVLKER